jgi:hypothetical protein
MIAVGVTQSPYLRAAAFDNAGKELPLCIYRIGSGNTPRCLPEVVHEVIGGK